MKLISLNTEGYRHESRVFDFLQNETPDTICLQEAPEDFSEKLQSYGYQVAFVPCIIKKIDERPYTEGVMLAAKELENVQSYFYRKPTDTLAVFSKEKMFNTYWRPILMADIHYEDDVFSVATTHFCWSPDGLMSPNQEEGMRTFRQVVAELPAHVMCGDFNIPRSVNDLYPELLKHYHDAVPGTYASSLDASLHRHGNDPDKERIFTSYMVDYVFTQQPYTASDVRLEFGVSDHAAVVANLTKVN